jgi:hypothetical protein
MIGVLGPQPETIFYCQDMADPTLREPRFARLRAYALVVDRRLLEGSHRDCKLVLAQTSAGTFKVRVAFTPSLVGSSPARR